MRCATRKAHDLWIGQLSGPWRGTILWVSGALAGVVHETAAVRIWSILAVLRHAGPIALVTRGMSQVGEMEHDLA